MWSKVFYMEKKKMKSIVFIRTIGEKRLSIKQVNCIRCITAISLSLIRSLRTLALPDFVEVVRSINLHSTKKKGARGLFFCDHKQKLFSKNKFQANAISSFTHWTRKKELLALYLLISCVCYKIEDYLLANGRLISL